MAPLRWEPERLTSCLSDARHVVDRAGTDDTVALSRSAVGLLEVVAPGDARPSVAEEGTGGRAALVVDLIEQALTSALT
jgi:hypothetical protein